MLVQPRHTEILGALHWLNVFVSNRNAKLALYLSVVKNAQLCKWYNAEEIPWGQVIALSP